MNLLNLLTETKSRDFPLEIKSFKDKVDISLKSKSGVVLKEEFNRFVDDKTFLIGLGIWLGEGTKEIIDEKRIEIINSETLIIKKFLKFVKEIGIPTNRVRTKIILKSESNKDKKVKIKNATDFWIKKTKIPIKNFWKTIFIVGKTKRLRRLDFGTLTIRVLKGTLLFKLFTKWSNIL
jgi:hypothetical protein